MRLPGFKMLEQIKRIEINFTTIRPEKFRFLLLGNTAIYYCINALLYMTFLKITTEIKLFGIIRSLLKYTEL